MTAGPDASSMKRCMSPWRPDSDGKGGREGEWTNIGEWRGRDKGAGEGGQWRWRTGRREDRRKGGGGERAENEEGREVEEGGQREGGQGKRKRMMIERIRLGEGGGGGRDEGGGSRRGLERE